MKLTGEDVILVLLPFIWATLIGLPFAGIRISRHRRELFQKVSNAYFKFTLFFTLGSFIFLLGEKNWSNFLEFLRGGNIWLISFVVPCIIWGVSVYFFYRLWRDLLYGLKEDQE